MTTDEYPTPIKWRDVKQGDLLRMSPTGDLFSVTHEPRPQDGRLLIPIQYTSGNLTCVIDKDPSEEAYLHSREESPKPGRRWPGLGVGCVVVRDRTILLLERQGSHGAGTWTVPGGWCELWEHPYQTAERELAEETGLRGQAVRPLGWTDAQHVDEGVHAVTLWIECHLTAHEIQPRIMEPEKCSALEWVPIPKVPDYKLFLPLRQWWPTFMREDLYAR